MRPRRRISTSSRSRARSIGIISSIRLLAGDLSGLAPPIRAWIERYARRIRVRALAAFYAADAIVVAVALVARKSDNAGAQRFSRRVLTR